MQNISKFIFGAVALVAAVAVFWFFGDIVLYVLVAGVLALMCRPLVGKVAGVKIFGRNVPRWLAAIVGVLTVWAAILLFFVLFIPLISGKINDLAQLDYHSLFAPLSEPMADLGHFLQKYFNVSISQQSLTESFASQLKEWVSEGTVGNIVSSVFSVAGNVIVAVVSISFIAFYFMKEENLFVNMLRAVVPTRHEERVERAVESITQLLSRYFIGVVLQMTIMMLVVAIILICFGFRVQDAFFVGVIEGVFNIIPYVGPWVGFILSALAGLTFVTTSGMGLGYVLIVIAGTILVAQAIDNYFISPRVFSHQVNAHPLEIFLVTLVAGSCMGIFGMLVAIPAYTVLRVLAKEFLYNYKLVRKLTENV